MRQLSPGSRAEVSARDRLERGQAAAGLFWGGGGTEGGRLGCSGAGTGGRRLAACACICDGDGGGTAPGLPERRGDSGAEARGAGASSRAAAMPGESVRRSGEKTARRSGGRMRILSTSSAWVQ